MKVVEFRRVYSPGQVAEKSAAGPDSQKFWRQSVISVSFVQLDRLPKGYSDFVVVAD